MSTVALQEAERADVVDALLGIAPGSERAALRARRPDVIRAIEGSRAALFEPGDPGGLAAAERAALALRVATLEADAALADHYRARLAAIADAPQAAAVEAGSDDPALSPRLAALLRHAERLVRDPASAKPEHLAALAALGLSPRDIVVLSQLVSFVTFETRLLAGLRLLGA